VIAKADAIVTDDTRAGLENAPALVEADVETVFPNGFAANTVAAHLQAGVRALVALSKRRTNAAQAPEQILDQLVERYGMEEVAEILRPLLSELP